MPPAPSDRRLLIVTGALVALAGLVFASVLFFATGGGNATPKPAPVYIGLASDLRNLVTTKRPYYFAHPFGGTGFWLALEGGHLVALVARRPGTTSCTVKWAATQYTYRDCHGNRLTGSELERYPLQEPVNGSEAGGIIVDFRHIVAPPQPLPAA